MAKRRRYIRNEKDVYEIPRLKIPIDVTELELCLDWIYEIKGLDRFLLMESLNLSFNQIEEIENLDNLVNLRRLDLGYNKISKIKNLDSLRKLEELYLQENHRISKIEGLDNLTKLQVLKIGRNKISTIEWLDNLTSLRELDLVYNHLSSTQGLDSLVALEKLHLGFNKIKAIQGLNNLTSLKDLDLRYNQVSVIRGLENLTSLETLMLFSNKISKIQGLEFLTHLKELNLGYNEISKIEGLDNLVNLESLDLWKNPIGNDGLEMLLNYKKEGKTPKLKKVNLCTTNIDWNDQSVQDILHELEKSDVEVKRDEISYDSVKEHEHQSAEAAVKPQVEVSVKENFKFPDKKIGFVLPSISCLAWPHQWLSTESKTIPVKNFGVARSNEEAFDYIRRGWRFNLLVYDAINADLMSIPTYKSVYNPYHRDAVKQHLKEGIYKGDIADYFIDLYHIYSRLMPQLGGMIIAFSSMSDSDHARIMNELGDAVSIIKGYPEPGKSVEDMLGNINKYFGGESNYNDYKEWIRELLVKLGFQEDYILPWIEKNIDTVQLMPNEFSISKGFTGLGVVINKDWALKFDNSSRISREYGFYNLNLGKFKEFVPKIMQIDDPFTKDRKYGVLILENVFGKVETNFMKSRRLGFKRETPLIPTKDIEYMVDYILFMTGVMHSESTRNNNLEEVPETSFKDILGRDHHRYADDPLKNLGIHNLHFFRDTAPSPESQKMIDYYNAWRKEKFTCIIHGDIKFENIVEGYFVDPSQWGKGNELDDLAFFLSDIRLYKGREWFKEKVKQYVNDRCKYDKEFASEVIAGKRNYFFDEMILTGALQQQLALRDSVMKKRIIELHRFERVGYHFLLEDETSWVLNPKAHGY